MNIVSKKFLLIIAGAALLLAGCEKKPKRPDPSSTMLGQQGAGANTAQQIDPTTVATTPDAANLAPRTDGIIEDANSIRGLLQPVYFDFDKYDIKAPERAKLQEAAKYLKDHPDQRLLLEGHCDWHGTSEYNLALGDRRANAAKKYLTTIGVPVAKIETVSKGSEEAKKDADDAARAKDRRAEIVILKK